LTKKFKVSPIYLLPEIGSLSLTGLLAFLIEQSELELPFVTFFPETPSGVTLNASIFIALMAVAATVMYLLVKYGFKKIVRNLVKFSLIFVTFILLNWYGFIALSFVKVPEALYDVSLIVGSIVLTALLIFTIYRTRGASYMLAVTVIGALTGTFLGVSVPMLTAIVLLSALTIYDFVAVYKGPIGKMAKNAQLEEFVGAVFTYGDLTIGMGDIVFYSMLSSTAMMNFGVFPFIATSIGIIVGAFLGFKMLETREIFPGLPLALSIGLALLFASAFIQNILG